MFVTSIWLIGAAGYCLYECAEEVRGAEPLFSFSHRDELLKALSGALPISVGSLLLLMKVNQSDPVQSEVFLLCLITCVLGVYLGFRAKRIAFPDPSDPAVAEALWWLPDPDSRLPQAKR